MSVFGSIAVLLFARHYFGIFADGAHYALVAIYSVTPEPWREEFLFSDGRQNFTIFPILYGKAIELFGLSNAHLLAVLVGQAVWLGAVFLLAVSLFGRSLIAILAVLFVILLDRSAGCPECLTYNEMSGTPRLFAVGLSILALSLAIREQWGVSFISMIAALVMHPLMALPAALVIFLFRFGITVFSASVLLLGTLLALIMAQMQIVPFSLLNETYDPIWFQILYDTFPERYFTYWAIDKVTLALFQISVLLAACYYGDETQRRLAVALLTVGGGMLLISWLGTTFLQNVLITNLHPWRVIWILSLLGNMFAISILLNLAEAPGILSWLVAAALVYLLLPFLFIVSALSLFAFIASALAGIRLWRRKNFSLALLSICSALCLAILPVISFSVVLTDKSATSIVPHEWLGIGAALAVIAVLLLSKRSGRLLSEAASAFAMAILIFLGLKQWDQRSEYTAEFVEGEIAFDEGLISYLGDDLVYWESGIKELWLKLRRPSFFSCAQSASNMMQRKLAMEFEKRGSVLANLNSSDMQVEKHRWCPIKADLDARGPQNVSQLREVCRALPNLDILALRYLVPEAPFAVWRIRLTEGEVTQSFDSNVDPAHLTEELVAPANDLEIRFLYRCRDLVDEIEG